MNEKKFGENLVDFLVVLHVQNFDFVLRVRFLNVLDFDLQVLFHDQPFYDVIILEIVYFEFVIDLEDIRESR